MRTLVRLQFRVCGRDFTSFSQLYRSPTVLAAGSTSSGWNRRSQAHAGALVMVESAFREYGLARVIRTDNGGPFATKAIAGLSRLNVWSTQL